MAQESRAIESEPLPRRCQKRPGPPVPLAKTALGHVPPDALMKRSRKIDTRFEQRLKSLVTPITPYVLTSVTAFSAYKVTSSGGDPLDGGPPWALLGSATRGGSALVAYRGAAERCRIKRSVMVEAVNAGPLEAMAGGSARRACDELGRRSSNA